MQVRTVLRELRENSWGLIESRYFNWKLLITKQLLLIPYLLLENWVLYLFLEDWVLYLFLEDWVLYLFLEDWPSLK